MVNLGALIDYSRQSEFNTRMRMNHTQTQIIVGCGGVGFWLGLMLAMQGYTRFILIEGDKIDRSNLNRLPVPPRWVGRNKAVALRKLITMLRPMSNVMVHQQHFKPGKKDFLLEFLQRPNERMMIWDCTDNAHTQKEIFNMVRAQGDCFYRKIGYEGFQVGTYQNYDVWTVSDYQTGYRTSNACAATSALSAVLGFFAQGLGATHDINFKVDEYVTSGARVEPEEIEDETNINDAMQSLLDEVNEDEEGVEVDRG